MLQNYYEKILHIKYVRTIQKKGGYVLSLRKMIMAAGLVGMCLIQPVQANAAYSGAAYTFVMTDEENRDERLLCEAAPVNVPYDKSGCKSWKKTYMPYTAVTCKASKQYELLNSDMASTDVYTGLRMYNGRCCVAIGTSYGYSVGDYIDVILDNGNVIPCVVGDIKSDRDTDSSRSFNATDGSVVEFIVDYTIFQNLKDNTGTVNWIPGFDGSVVKIVGVSQIVMV